MDGDCTWWLDLFDSAVLLAPDSPCSPIERNLHGCEGHTGDRGIHEGAVQAHKAWVEMFVRPDRGACA